MIDDVDGHHLTGASVIAGITAAPISGQFASDGSAAVNLPVTVARSVPDGYYFRYLIAMVGESARRSTIVVFVGAKRDEPAG